MTRPNIMVERLRTRLGIWLLRPHAGQLLLHYRTAAANEHSEPEARQNCDYIVIGITYVMDHRQKRGPQ